MFRWFRLQDNDGDSAMDDVGNALRTINTEHANIHEGDAYSVSDTTTVAAGANLDILLKVPAGVYVHLRDFSFVADDAPATVVMYETPTTTADGTAITINNKNRVSTNTSGITAFVGTTVTVVGNQLQHGRITAQKNVGGTNLEAPVEWILAPSTNYLIRFNNGGTGIANVNYDLFWYE